MLSRSRVPFLRASLFVLAFPAAPAAFAQPAASGALTAADYARAEKFLAPTVNPLVIGGSVNAAWLPDDRFTYRNTTADGSEFDGLDGLRRYLLTKRRDAFLRQFSRKLLGYALGRGVQLSDTPLLDALVAKSDSEGAHVGDLVEMIVRSHQFREIRGRDFANTD